jgi:hypothetical protein
MARPGTKNTGNHLVNKVVAGPKASNRDLPDPGTIKSMVSKPKNKTIHPPKDVGNLILRFAKSVLTPCSSATMAKKPTMASVGKETVIVLVEVNGGGTFFFTAAGAGATALMVAFIS